MTGATASARAYALALEPAGSALRAVVRREGPDQPVTVALGRPAADAAPLAALLHPLCPIAHAAAALGAIESAYRREPLNGGQGGARATLVLAEAATMAVFRAGVAWAGLLGRPPLVDPVRRARAALEALNAALFVGEWRRVGGAPLRLDAAGIAAALRDLDAAASAAQPIADAVVDAGDGVALARRPDAPAPLGAAIQDVETRPDTAAWEETPHGAAGGGVPSTLGLWFSAQARWAADLTKLTRAAAEGLTDAAPEPAPEDCSGHGLAIAPTARGRLRHMIRLENGRIAAWRVDAPTDWNFASQGPAAWHAARLDPAGDLRRDAALLVAAFDPCAPCTVAIREVAHA